MDEGEAMLARRLGSLLRTERERRGISQEAFAAGAGVAQQQLSRFERGARPITSTLADRMFGVLGLQLRVDVEASGGHRDAAIEGVRAELVERQRGVFADLQLFALRAPRFGYVIDGAAAALLQGVPVPAPRIDLLVAEGELDALAEWVQFSSARRYDEKRRDFLRYDTDPRDPGPRWWRTAHAEVKVRLVATLPPPVLVTVTVGGDGEEHRAAVRALPAVEGDFPEVARVLRRLRDR
ncbi:helix-turn-helix domain-containing protein [Catellatospora vulcania]|uniref:helix-turn-helix domain-containing protein n=1 Tax=Catellatospora vulcania TaxID=1460450 RepID=UPI0018AFCB39|nr:helix-turn-helix transcriptional regulator [Catellatospora vulcania]